MSLTPEERRRIYEEEKARMEAQAQLQRERITPLETAIESYLRQGFRVLSRSETTAQLIKPRRYNPTFGCLGFLTLGVFWVIGLLIFLLEKDQLVYLSLDNNGHVLVDNRLSDQSYAGTRPQSTPTDSLATISGRWWGRQALWVKIIILGVIIIYVAMVIHSCSIGGS